MGRETRQQIQQELRAEEKRRDRLLAAHRLHRGDTATGDGQTRKSLLKQKALGTPHDPRQAPAARGGQSMMSSDGYSFYKLAALTAGFISPEEAKEELYTAGQVTKSLRHCPGWRPAPGAVVAPLCPAFLIGDAGTNVMDSQVGKEISEKMWVGGKAAYDPEQVSWLTQKSGQNGLHVQDWTPDTQRVGSGTQSWIQQNLGGSLIPFPEIGPLIPLLRNKNALLTAGASLNPLPPQGRLAWPRETSPASAYPVGEGQAITGSTVGTDQMLLTAKKIGALITLNNELVRYGGPIVEQIFRNSMMISLALTMDYYFLQGEGSDNIPAGLLNYPGVQSYNGTGNGTTTNGYTFAPGDVYSMAALVAAANATMTGWILRPEFWGAIQAKRASVLASGDNLGLFLFNVLRGLGQGGDEEALGAGKWRVTTTPQVPNNRVKGTGTNLVPAFSGMWPDYQIALFGTIEFAATNTGSATSGGASVFAQDQSMIRALLFGDGGPWHPGSFVVADQLLPTTVGN